MYVVLVHATFANLADAQHVFNQAQAVAVNASVAHIGDASVERSSYALLGEEVDGQLQVSQAWHLDLFGIVRAGQPVFDDAPPWIQPTGAHDAYPAATPTLTAAGVLGVHSAFHGHAAELVALIQAHVLQAQGAYHAHTAQPVTLVSAGALGVHGSAHLHTAQAVDLTRCATSPAVQGGEG